MNNEDIITRWCKVSVTDIKTLIRFFSKQPISIQIKILKKHREILFKNKIQMKEHSIAIEAASYIALILAVKYHYALEKKLTTVKFEEMSTEEMRDISMIQLEKFEAKYMQQGIRDQLKHYWSVVKILKNENKSFRKISAYLEHKYKFKISHSEIFKAWNEIEKL